VFALDTEIAERINEWVLVHASVTYQSESLLVMSGLGTDLQVSLLDLNNPVLRNLKSLQLFVTESSSSKCFKLET